MVGDERDVAGPLLGAVDAHGDDAQALDDVDDVDGDADHVEHQRGAVEEHVGLGGLVQLEDEADEAGADGDVQDAAYERRGGVQELEVGLQDVEVGGRVLGQVPEDVVVVGEEGEEDAKEEACCCLVCVRG